MLRVTDGGAYVQVKTERYGLLSFWAESGWHAWDGMFRWRLVPLCTRCEEPVTAPVKAEDDPLDRTWCSEACRDADAEGAYEQRYQPGVAT
jgi:hypothetical protein